MQRSRRSTARPVRQAGPDLPFAHAPGVQAADSAGEARSRQDSSASGRFASRSAASFEEWMVVHEFS